MLDMTQATVTLQIKTTKGSIKSLGIVRIDLGQVEQGKVCSVPVLRCQHDENAHVEILVENQRIDKQEADKTQQEEKKSPVKEQALKIRKDENSHLVIMQAL